MSSAETDTGNIVDLFLSAQSKGSRYLFGCNEHSAALSQRVEIDGFIDDYKSGSVFCGKPVVCGEQVPCTAVVVNCSFAIRPLASNRRIAKLKIAHQLDYSDLLSRAPSVTPRPGFVVDMLNDLGAHASHWQALPQLLADDESRKVLHDVVCFRQSADLACMAGYTCRPAEQYFDHVCCPQPGDVFADCGGFDGDTTEQFVQRCPDYRRVWLFEPSDQNMRKAKERLAGMRDINFVPKGVSDKAGTLRFNADAGSASAVTESGDLSVAVTTLDEAIDEPVSFVKMDLEGWELKALGGARRHIERDHPKLAIAVYHQASEFWKIPEFVLAIRQDYNVYLRHYTEGWTETVMYFVQRPA